MNSEKKIQQIISDISNQLISCCNTKQGANQEAWWLLEKITAKSKTQLLKNESLTLDSNQKMQLDEWIKERVSEKKPLQYILGSVPFCGVEIMVEPPILIPRPETEEWVSWLIDHMYIVRNERFRILDLCTGSGCIALALAKAFPSSEIIGVDINPAAIRLAKRNKEYNALDNVQFFVSNLFSEFIPTEQFDLIVSNPPYVTSTEYEQLPESVRLWEDALALRAPNDGLAFYKHIAQHAPMHLMRQSILGDNQLPQIVVELGQRKNEVKKIFQATRFDHIKLYCDMQGIERWLACF